MPTLLPTPFDIIEPGPGQLIPSEYAWLALLVMTLLGAALIVFMRRTRSPQKITSTLQVLVDELRIIGAGAQSRPDIERVSRLGRRIISPYFVEDVTSMSCSELQSHAVKIRNRANEESVSLAEAILLLAKIEEIAYAPDTSLDGNTELRTLTDSLVAGLESHIRRFRPI